MRFVTISDTHGKHKDVKLPSGDVLIHAGDITNRGNENEVIDFLKWFESQDYQCKVFIAGNHDFYFEREPSDKIRKLIPCGINYLCNNEVVINGVRIWGSPITPWFFNWAFNRHRGEKIRRYWEQIPANTDIVITHGPVFNILDRTKDGKFVGCEDLLDVINTLSPKIHICGHIHEAYGVVEKPKTKFINASLLNEKYELKNKPLIFDI